jgi:hypothetical protein
MRQLRREIRERQIRLTLAVTLAAHAGAAATVPWPGAAGVVGSAIGAGCLLAAYFARRGARACPVRAMRRETRS